MIHCHCILELLNFVVGEVRNVVTVIIRYGRN